MEQPLLPKSRRSYSRELIFLAVGIILVIAGFFLGQTHLSTHGHHDMTEIPLGVIGVAPPQALDDDKAGAFPAEPGQAPPQPIDDDDAGAMPAEAHGDLHVLRDPGAGPPDPAEWVDQWPAELLDTRMYLQQAGFSRDAFLADPLTEEPCTKPSELEDSGEFRFPGPLSGPSKVPPEPFDPDSDPDSIAGPPDMDHSDSGKPAVGKSESMKNQPGDDKHIMVDAIVRCATQGYGWNGICDCPGGKIRYGVPRSNLWTHWRVFNQPVECGNTNFPTTDLVNKLSSSTRAKWKWSTKICQCWNSNSIQDLPEKRKVFVTGLTHESEAQDLGLGVNQRIHLKNLAEKARNHYKEESTKQLTVKLVGGVAGFAFTTTAVVTATVFVAPVLLPAIGGGAVVGGVLTGLYIVGTSTGSYVCNASAQKGMRLYLDTEDKHEPAFDGAEAAISIAANSFMGGALHADVSLLAGPVEKFSSGVVKMGQDFLVIASGKVLKFSGTAAWAGGVKGFVEIITTEGSAEVSDLTGKGTVQKIIEFGTSQIDRLIDGKHPPQIVAKDAGFGAKMYLTLSQGPGMGRYLDKDKCVPTCGKNSIREVMEAEIEELRKEEISKLTPKEAYDETLVNIAVAERMIGFHFSPLDGFASRKTRLRWSKCKGTNSEPVCYCFRKGMSFENYEKDGFLPILGQDLEFCVKGQYCAQYLGEQSPDCIWQTEESPQILYWLAENILLGKVNCFGQDNDVNGICSACQDGLKCVIETGAGQCQQFGVGSKIHCVVEEPGAVRSP